MDEIKNLKEKVRAYLIELLEITEQEFNNMFKRTDEVGTGSDCKIALSHAIKANRELSKIKSYAKAIISQAAQEEKKSELEAKEKIHNYIRGLQAGLFPLGDKEIVERDFAEYLKWKSGKDEWGQPSGECEEKTARPMPRVWSVFESEGLDRDNPPKFTYIDINEITSIPVLQSTPAALDKAAKAYARRLSIEIVGKCQGIEVAVSELLEGVRKEISALGSCAQIISSEQYGINRFQKVEDNK